MDNTNFSVRASSSAKAMRHAALPAILALLSFLPSSAGQRLEVSAGHETARCTYLSPVTYTGPGYGLFYEWSHPSWREGKAGMQAHADVSYGYLLNPAGNSRMYDLAVNLDWGVQRLWSLTKGWSATAGATVGIDGGVMYLPRNGNNPAQAQMWAGIAATGSVAYSGLRLAGKPLTISESVYLPALGAFFSPQYGETYYEIYVGNHNGLAHFGWPGNRPQIKSRLRADWLLGRHALTVGFDYRFQGLESCHITTRRAVCSAVVGISF